jgi:hypothetical protein
MLADAPAWSTGVEVDLECGQVNQTPIRARTVAYYYATATVAAAGGGLAAPSPP